MELFDQKAKAEMERCKKVAKEAGLRFDDNTLEYVISNRDMLELSPKVMIPTLYDYWVHDVGAIQNRRQYEAFPHNPYETVINTRPPISFYNQDNADWFNVMIFYHVLGHIDFFQNNVFFRNTWDDDFTGQALGDKRLVNRIRDELGSDRRWVDYVIEFSRSIDNLVGYFEALRNADKRDNPELFGFSLGKADFYFGQFLRELYEEKAVEREFYHTELNRFNECIDRLGPEEGEKVFFEDNRLRGMFPEFQGKFKKWTEDGSKQPPTDIFEYLWENSDFLNREENLWMKDIMQVVRRTSMYFQPQMRTKICNEGWASLWHQRLFIPDEKIQGHEVNYARVDSGVTSLRDVGINPYAIGKLLFEFIEDLGSKGRLSREYQMLKDIELRREYDKAGGPDAGKNALFEARKYLNDELLINFLSESDFQDFVDKNRLYVVGVRPHREEFGKAEIYIKSKNGEDYRKLLNKQLYHPPHIIINEDKAEDGELYLDHVYEGRQLDLEQISSVLIGLEYLWGGPVALETVFYEEIEPSSWWEWQENGYKKEYDIYRVVFRCFDRVIDVDIVDD